MTDDVVTRHKLDFIAGFMEDDSSSAARSTKASGSLAASRYRVSFIAKDALDLPSYLGSTLRGAFGHAFRTIACPAPMATARSPANARII